MGARTAITLVSLAITVIACGKGSPRTGTQTTAGSGGISATAGAPGSGGAATLSGSGGVTTPAASGGTTATGGASAGGSTIAGSGGAATGGAGGAPAAAGGGGVTAAAGTSGGGRAGGGGGQGGGAPGSCGLSRTIRLPSPTYDARYTAPVRRQLDGFVVGPWASQDATGASILNWVRVDAREAVTAHSALAMSMTGGVILNDGSTDELAAVMTSSLGAGPATFYARVAALQDGMTSAPSTQALFDLPSYALTFDPQFVGPALDGQHWLFVAGPGQGKEIDVVVAGLDGKPIAPVQTVSTPDSWTCGALQPTGAAGIVTVVQRNPGGTESLLFVELSATGGIKWQSAFALRRDRPPGWNASALPCPMVALSDEGVASLTYEMGLNGAAWHLRRVDHDGNASDDTWDALSSGTPRGLAIRGQTAMAILRHSDGTVGVVKRVDGHDDEWPLPLANAITVLGSDGPIASEAGRLFLDVSGTTNDSSVPGQRAIVEVTCL